MDNPDFSVFDGNADLDEVLQFLIDEGFVPREPTVAEKLFLPHDPGTVVGSLVGSMIMSSPIRDLFL